MNGFLPDLDLIKSEAVKQKLPKKPKKVLKMDKHLPQIIVPANKIKMFIDWWNSDIRFESTIPKAFNSGYIIIETNAEDLKYSEDKYKDIIKRVAKTLHLSYRTVENEFISFLDISKTTTMYFTFTSENSMYVETYMADGTIASSSNFGFGQTDEPEKPINLDNPICDILDKQLDSLMNELNYHNLAILISCLWYIATTTKSTKYIYEKKSPQVTSRHKNVVNVSDTKTINTPIYDMNKIRVVKTESLVSRKKGWTYSHSFEVHGHYRHYKSGKVIFIEPYIKGQNKEFKSQVITLSPSE